MAIRTSLGALAAAEGALRNLAGLKLPIKTAYQLSKVAKLAQAELEHWHARRNEWVHELGQQVDVDAVKVKPENMPTFLSRLEELGQLAVDVAADPVNLGECGDVAISAADVLALVEAGLAVMAE